MTQGLVNILKLFSLFFLCVFEHTLVIGGIFFQIRKGAKIMDITSIYNKIETEFSIINDANSLISIAVRGINHYPENFVKVIL
ncbi:hypothetical protein FHZ98_10665, partial [Listeria monocytogenes]|nr:hypothetical protein [Listeria monocytogenes]